MKNLKSFSLEGRCEPNHTWLLNRSSLEAFVYIGTSVSHPGCVVVESPDGVPERFDIGALVYKPIAVIDSSVVNNGDTVYCGSTECIAFGNEDSSTYKQYIQVRDSDAEIRVYSVVDLSLVKHRIVKTGWVNIYPTTAVFSSKECAELVANSLGAIDTIEITYK